MNLDNNNKNNMIDEDDTIKTYQFQFIDIFPSLSEITHNNEEHIEFKIHQYDQHTDTFDLHSLLSEQMCIGVPLTKGTSMNIERNGIAIASFTVNNIVKGEQWIKFTNKIVNNNNRQKKKSIGSSIAMSLMDCIRIKIISNDEFSYNTVAYSTHNSAVVSAKKKTGKNNQHNKIKHKLFPNGNIYNNYNNNINNNRNKKALPSHSIMLQKQKMLFETKQSNSKSKITSMNNNINNNINNSNIHNDNCQINAHNRSYEENINFNSYFNNFNDDNDNDNSQTNEDDDNNNNNNNNSNHMNNNNYFAYNISANNSLPSEAIMLGHDDNNNNNNIQIKKQKKKHSVNMNIRKGGANTGKFLKLSAILRDNSNNKLKNKNSVNNSMSTKTRNVSFGKQNNETTPLQSIMNNSNTNNNNTNHTNINIIHVNNANTNKTINLTATMNNNTKPPLTYNTNINTNTSSNNNNKQLKTRHSKSKNNLKQRQQPKQQKLKDTTTNINKTKQQKQNMNNNNNSNSNSNTKNADIIPLINSPLSSSLSIELDKINNNNKSPVNSFLLANDNNTLLNESFSQVKNDFSTLYTSEYINGIPNDLLKLEIELLFEKIFELVSCYHTSFTKEKATYDKLRKMCNESMKKYQRLYKKNQKMQKRKQQMQMKQTAVKDTNIVDLLLVNLEEIKLFKQIIQKKNITHNNSGNNGSSSDDYTNNETKRKFNHIFHCVFDSNINSNFCLTFCNKEQKQFIINKLRQQQHQP